ncbi:MAG: hypothetical protein LH606_01910 [Cytophagaceae bacterium]|nr:hypothetical protein [Cytophagaceae bacterium]
MANYLIDINLPDHFSLWYTDDCEYVRDFYRLMHTVWQEVCDLSKRNKLVMIYSDRLEAMEYLTSIAYLTQRPFSGAKSTSSEADHPLAPKYFSNVGQRCTGKNTPTERVFFPLLTPLVAVYL